MTAFRLNILFLLALCCPISLFTQTTGLILKGQVLDGQGANPITFASVTLHQSKDSVLITGSLTDEAGGFSLSGLKPGLYLLKIKYIGYKTYLRDSILLSPGTNRDMGKILLRMAGKELNGVTITAEDNAFRLGMDKKIFEVDKDLNSQGGSAVDVLKNIPSISMDVDGNISLRGTGNVTVLIDGHPSGMVVSNRTSIFEQIPASAIERIELITNPSAKYDPDGVAGIINIVLKKNKAEGFNLTGTLSYATWIKGNGALNAGYRKGKLNLFASYNYRYNQRDYNGYTNRLNQLTHTSFSSDQTSGGIITSQTHMLKAGMDYDFNKSNSFSVSVLLNTDRSSDTDHVRYTWLDGGRNLNRYASRNMFGINKDLGFDISASYRHEFLNPDKLFSVEFSASGNNNRALDSICELDYNANGTYSKPYPVLQLTDNAWMYRNGFLKADFTQPLGTSSRIESGAKINMRNADDKLTSVTFSYPLGVYQNDTGISNRFQYNETVCSAYLLYSKTWGRVRSQLGVRAEDAWRSAALLNKEVVYNHQYLDFFPSGYLSYKSGLEQEWRLGYGRRVNRPSIRSLNPFPDYTDILNLRYGNPDLNPEYIDAVELSWMRYFKKCTFNAVAYYRHTQGVMQIFKYLADTVSGATVSTIRNLSSSDAWGLELTARADPFRWWSLILNGNMYALQLQSTDPAMLLFRTGQSGYVKGSSRINFTGSTALQLSGAYYFPGINAQGTTQAYYYLDLGLRKELAHGKGGLSLSLADVFNTIVARSGTQTATFTQDYLKKKESRIATLSFTWRFGKLTENKKPKTDELPAPPPDVE
ncbi:MAG: outer membrane beta-barrel protein [Bacteroidia bacterium]